MSELPVGQIPVVWELFQTESSNYLPSIIHYQDDPNSSDTRFSKFHHFVQMWTAFIANISVSSQNAEPVISLAKKTCTSFFNASLSIYLSPKVLYFSSEIISQGPKIESPVFLPWLLSLYNEILTIIENAKLHLPISQTTNIEPFFSLIDESKTISLLEFMNRFSIAENSNLRLMIVRTP